MMKCQKDSPSHLLTTKHWAAVPTTYWLLMLQA
jgi:hypothetical protein